MGSKEEFCNLYDENRNLLGKVHRRGEKLAPGEYVMVVGIWIINSKNEILLTKRHPEKKTAPGLWEYTGGHVMAGETSAEAALRELQEETGITAQADELHHIGSVKIEPFHDDDYYIIRDVSMSDIVFQERETVAAKWVTYAEFLRMDETGELAPYVMEFLTPIRDKVEAVFGYTLKE